MNSRYWALERLLATSTQARWRARSKGLFPSSDGGCVSSMNSMIAGDSNSGWPSTSSTGTFPRGEMARDQSGLALRSM